MRICEKDGCENKHEALGLCKKDWKNARRRIKRGLAPDALLKRGRQKGLKQTKEAKQKMSIGHLIHYNPSGFQLQLFPQVDFKAKMRYNQAKFRATNPADVDRHFIRRQVMWLVKSTLGCARCPERDPRVLDWNHIDRKTKSANISKLMTGSLERLIEELLKCEVLCANCHRKETAEQLNWNFEVKDSEVIREQANEILKILQNKA